MSKYIITAFLLIYLSSSTFAQSWLWGVQATNNPSSYGEGYGAATDKSGNEFITGFFEYNIHFGTYSFNTPSASIDAYLAKYDYNGNLLWAIQSTTPSSASLCEATCVATDAWGNSFMAGNYEDTATIGTFMVHDVTPPFYLDGMYVAKISPGGGVIWAKQSKAANPSSGGNINAVTTDKSGNVYITGQFQDTVYFGKDTLHTSFVSCFIVKCDSAGNVIWAKQANSTFGAYSYGLNVDKFGNIFITGCFFGSITFGGFPLASLNTWDMFLAKYNPTGNVIWAKQANVPSTSAQIEGYAVTSDISGNAYVTGYFYDTATIGAITLKTPVPDSDAFIAKYDSNGHIAWVQQTFNKDNNDWLGYAIAADSLNHIYLSFGGWGVKEKNPNIELIIGLDTFKTYNPGFDDASIVAMLDTTGKAVCGIITPSVGDDRNVVSCDPSGKYVYLSGDLGTTATFGPDVLTFSYSESPVVARWQPCTETGIEEVQGENVTVELYPNPSNGNFIIDINALKEECKIEIYNMLGENIYHSALNSGMTSVNLSSASAGIYLYRVITKNGNLIANGKLVIQ